MLVIALTQLNVFLHFENGHLEESGGCRRLVRKTGQSCLKRDHVFKQPSEEYKPGAGEQLERRRGEEQ